MGKKIKFSIVLSKNKKQPKKTPKSMYEWERNIPSLSFIEKQIFVSNTFYFLATQTCAGVTDV